MSVSPVKLSDGVDGVYISNSRFNTTTISFNFYLPLRFDTIAENALLPYILTSCSAKYKTFTELNMELSMLYGADLTVSVNKVGDAQHIKIAISVINDEYSLSDTPVTKQAISLLTELIFNPLTENGAFLSADTERERRKLLEHVIGEINDKRIYARNRLISEMFSGLPAGVSAHGTVDAIQKITNRDLFNAWQRFLTNAYIRVQVVGKNSPEEIFNDISAKFSGLNRTVDESFRKTENLLSANAVKRVTDKMDVTQGKLVMGFSSELHGPDAYALSVATDIFGGGPYSGLFENVREKLSLCYYCSASAKKLKGYVMVDSGVELENAQKAEKEILNQLEIVKNGKFSEFTYNASIKSIVGSLNSYNDSISTIDAWYSLNISNKELKSPEEVADIISRVTVQDVIKAANGIKLHTVYSLLPNKEGE